MRRLYLLPLPVLALICASPQQTAAAQQTPSAPDSFIARWQARATATQNEQPHWATPLVQVTPRLEQEFRSDFVRQITSTTTTTWNNGNSKGLELIPARHFELLFNAPPYIQHNSKTRDGFGDVSFLAKYRIVSANEEHGNYIATFFIGGTCPTGTYTNGSVGATISPTLALGKGYKMFDVETTAGAAFPASNTRQLGRPVTWNTTLQGHFSKYFWPEVESNATFYNGGPSDGNIQEFITPGMIIGRFHPSKTHQRFGFTFGAGEEIATSHFHSNNHVLVVTGRIPF